METSQKEHIEKEKQYASYKAEIVHILDLSHQLFMSYGNYNWNYNIQAGAPELMTKLASIKKRHQSGWYPEHSSFVNQSTFECNPMIRDSYLRIRNLDISQLEPPVFLGIKDLLKDPIEVPDGNQVKTNNDELVRQGWVYHGTYFNKKKEGWGKLMSPDRSQFWEGYFENGLSEGYGLWTHKGGHFYIGNYKNGLRHGYGLYFFPTGNFTFHLFFTPNR
jgi:hypothetical protein